VLEIASHPGATAVLLSMTSPSETNILDACLTTAGRSRYLAADVLVAVMTAVVVAVTAVVEDGMSAKVAVAVGVVVAVTVSAVSGSTVLLVMVVVGVEHKSPQSSAPSPNTVTLSTHATARCPLLAAAASPPAAQLMMAPSS
jgi:hypothetical protein